MRPEHGDRGRALNDERQRREDQHADRDRAIAIDNGEPIQQVNLAVNWIGAAPGWRSRAPVFTRASGVARRWLPLLMSLSVGTVRAHIGGRRGVQHPGGRRRRSDRDRLRCRVTEKSAQWREPKWKLTGVVTVSPALTLTS